ncbi:DoxX family protein [Kocuria flava]|uniref:DoxX family protein n=1 Tax=Kocuria flava TaxID=446860 RepID=UPI001FF40622|nr:DoxX family protein [Kocuria flava]MCJ8504116.1 DoxX family protein [Kocuria flava]
MNTTTTAPAAPASSRPDLRPGARPEPAATTLGLTLLRVVLGTTFLLHGWQKVDEWTVAGTQAAFAQMGVPAAQAAAPAVAVLELAGGILLVLGLGTRVVAALLALVMLGALVLVHLPAGFFAADGGIELVLLLAAAAALFALAGAGRWSADAALAARRRTA